MGIKDLIKYLFYKKEYKYFNFANTKFLINHFWNDWEFLKSLFNEIKDEKLKSEFLALTKINQNTLSSILATANIALNPIAINDNLEKLTSNNSIDFKDFRKEKSVIYIKIPWQKQNQYSFLLNIFYQQFFNSMMSELPKDKDLPIFCLLDEFWNMNLPNFETTITTIRKYNVSISIILQNIKQLENKYWKANAQTILNGGIASKLFFSGADLETTEMLSKILWEKKEVIRAKNGLLNIQDVPIMKDYKIRTMWDNEALFIMANKLPLKLKVKPYFRDSVFKSFTKIVPFKVKKNKIIDKIEYIKLNLKN